MELNISGIKISIDSYSDRIATIDKHFQNKISDNFTIGYANASTIILLHSFPDLRDVLSNMTAIYADGTGVRIAGDVLLHRHGKIEEQNATDFNHKILEYASHKKMKVFFLGGNDSVGRALRSIIRSEYPGISITGVHHGYFENDETMVVQKINESHSDILFVGMGQPKQELWISENTSQLNVPLIVSVGGFLDYLSGEKIRAPKIFRFLGLEWLFRMAVEPRRLWRRYIIGIPHFCWIIAKEKINQ